MEVGTAIKVGIWGGIAYCCFKRDANQTEQLSDGSVHPDYLAPFTQSPKHSFFENNCWQCIPFNARKQPEAVSYKVAAAGQLKTISDEQLIRYWELGLWKGETEDEQYTTEMEEEQQKRWRANPLDEFCPDSMKTIQEFTEPDSQFSYKNARTLTDEQKSHVSKCLLWMHAIYDKHSGLETNRKASPTVVNAYGEAFADDMQWGMGCYQILLAQKLLKPEFDFETNGVGTHSTLCHGDKWPEGTLNAGCDRNFFWNANGKIAYGYAHITYVVENQEQLQTEARHQIDTKSAWVTKVKKEKHSKQFYEHNYEVEINADYDKKVGGGEDAIWGGFDFQTWVEHAGTWRKALSPENFDATVARLKEKGYQISG